MTLDQGQGHRNETEQICHAKFECRSLNTVREMAIVVQVKHLSVCVCVCSKYTATALTEEGG